MSTDHATLLTLTHNQTRALVGRPWQLFGQPYRFADFDPQHPGQTPWIAGAEGFAYPLLNSAGQAAAYLKFFSGLRVSKKRVDRVRWLANQGISTWTPELRGAPRAWIDTEENGAPESVDFQFSCSFADAVPGKTWLELKLEITEGHAGLDDDQRQRCIVNLIRGLAYLESRQLVHGDLSPNNVLIDLEPQDSRPYLYIIDFDAFYAPQLPALAALSAAEGGTFGTDGYCPPELASRAIVEPASAFPFSDRYARDMLLLELACFDADCNQEEPPTRWPPVLLREKLRRSQLVNQLPYLFDDDLSQLAEADRPSSGELARWLRVSTPPRIKISNPTRFAVPQANSIERYLRHIIVLLWVLCVLHWAVVSFTFAAWLTPTDARSNFTASLLRLGTCLLLGVAATLGGIAVTTMTAFAERQARVIQLPGIALSLPPRRNLYRSELKHRARVVAQLCALLLTLVGCAYLMATT